MTKQPMEFGAVFWTCENTRKEEAMGLHNKVLPRPVMLVQRRSENYWLGLVLPVEFLGNEDAMLGLDAKYRALPWNQMNKSKLPDDAPNYPEDSTVLVESKHLFDNEKEPLDMLLRARIGLRRLFEEEITAIGARLTALRRGTPAHTKKVRPEVVAKPPAKHRHNRKGR